MLFIGIPFLAAGVWALFHAKRLSQAYSMVEYTNHVIDTSQHSPESGALAIRKFVRDHSRCVSPLLSPKSGAQRDDASVSNSS